MNKAISLKKQLPKLYQEASEAKERLNAAEFELNLIRKEIESSCTHKHEDDTSALSFNAHSMYREWGTCQICGKYMET